MLLAQSQSRPEFLVLVNEAVSVKDIKKFYQNGSVFKKENIPKMFVVGVFFSFVFL